MSAFTRWDWFVVAAFVYALVGYYGLGVMLWASGVDWRVPASTFSSFGFAFVLLAIARWRPDWLV